MFEVMLVVQVQGAVEGRRVANWWEEVGRPQLLQEGMAQEEVGPTNPSVSDLLS